MLCPSISALRKLLLLCESYVSAYGLGYNALKSEFMAFKTGSKTALTTVPAFIRLINSCSRHALAARVQSLHRKRTRYADGLSSYRIEDVNRTLTTPIMSLVATIKFSRVHVLRHARHDVRRSII